MTRRWMSLGSRPKFWLIAVIALLAFVPLALTGERADTIQPDSTGFVTPAYNLVHHGVFTEYGGPSPAPGLSREPAYGFLLAATVKIFGLDNALSWSCVTPLTQQDCPKPFIRLVIALNAVLIALTGVAAAATARLLGAGPVGTLAALFLILANFDAQGWRATAMSDYLAMAFAALAAWGFAGGLVKADWRRSSGGGLALSGLCLTKVVFLPVLLLLPLVLLASLRDRPMPRRIAASILLTALTLVPLAAWVARNAVVLDKPAITQGRANEAFGTREALSQMPLSEVPVAFVYWTRAFGDDLAKAWFGRETALKFDVGTPDGYYLRGQLGPGIRAQDLMAAEGISQDEAVRRVRSEILDRLAANWPGYLWSMPAVFYRGIWIDSFALFTVPALFWLGIRAVRRKRWADLGAIGVGAASLALYAAFSLNIPRYQLTAIPALAVAGAMAIEALIIRRRARDPLSATRSGLRTG